MSTNGLGEILKQVQNDNSLVQNDSVQDSFHHKVMQRLFDHRVMQNFVSSQRRHAELVSASPTIQLNENRISPRLVLVCNEDTSTLLRRLE